MQAMKVRLLIIFLISAIFLIKNAESVSQPKLNKTFDEIFGKGWDAEVPEFTETKEWHKMKKKKAEVENKSTDQDNPNEQSFSDHFESFANRKIRERFDEMFDENWSEGDNEFIEEDEAASTDQNDCIDGQKCQKLQENNTKLIKRSKNDYSDQQKRKIVEEFISSTEKYKGKRKHSQDEWKKMYAQIAKSFGVGYSTIKNWKKEFGLSHKLHSKHEKMEKLKHYCEIKKCNPKINDFEIAERLNIGRSTLRLWKKELKNTVKDENNCSLQMELDQIDQDKFYSDQQKREILKQFDEIKSKCKKAKLKNFLKYELDDKIAKKLGVSRTTISRWKSKFGLSVSKNFSDATKIAILKKYDQIKRKNPKMADAVIADMLKISTGSLRKWKKEFEDEIKNL